MKLTAKVNGVQQEIELSKEDVYVVECGSKERANKVLKSINVEYLNDIGWVYVSNKPIFDGNGYEDFNSFITDIEPIPPDTPIISFEDWERLIESDKAEPAPTKWRFKTQKEFDDTCEKNDDGWYKCGRGVFFTPAMHYLFGKEYAGGPDNLILHDDWFITPEMLMPLEEVEAPTQKWEKVTRGGYLVNILREDRGDGCINIEYFVDDVWLVATLHQNGRYLKHRETSKDLIPLNRESILKEIEEYENKIKELKAKLQRDESLR